MNLLITTIGRRGYLVDYFKECSGIDNVFGTSNSEWTPGFNYCDKNFLISSISSRTYIDDLIRLCITENVNVIISCFDLDIEKISKNKQLFYDNGIIPIIPEPDTSRICFDKFATFEFCKLTGLDTPCTYLSLEEATRDISINKINFPLIIKPRFGFGSSHIFKANTFKQLETFFTYQKDMIIQEFCKGKEYSFDMLYDLNQKHIRTYCKMKISMRAGETDQAKMVWNKKIFDFSNRIGALLKNVGPLDVDFFYDEVEDTLRILEFNPRFGGGYPISHASGADYPNLMVKLLNGDDINYELKKYDDNVILMKEYSFIYSMPHFINLTDNDK